jgi:hypothetical protein
VDTDTLDHAWQKLEVPQLIRKTIKAGEQAVPTDYHHTIYEVEGDMTELGQLEDSELIDKKIVKRETDTALILESDLSLGQEVEEYLRYVLALNDAGVEKVLLEFSNYADQLPE